MKYSLRILLIEIGIILSSLFCLIVFPINYNIYLLVLIILSIALHFLLKTEKRKERFHTDILLIIIISVLFYYAITYFFGFFSGFYYSSYSKTFTGIASNILISTIVIITIETIREILIKNNAYHKSIILLTPIICVLLELPSLISLKLYTSKIDIFNIIISIIVPCIVKNIMLTSVTLKTSKRNSMVYQFMMTIPNYFLPVFPNLGDFFTLIVKSLVPIVVLILTVNITIVKTDKIKNSRKLSRNKTFTIILNTACIIVIAVMLYLTSNMFRFTSLAIGSESMTGSINKGDIVIIDKKVKTVKEGEVIAFEELGKIVVHRVIDIVDEDGKVYQTKGDANKDKDAWLVKEANTVGKVKVRIRWLGWPTVALSELIQ